MTRNVCASVEPYSRRVDADLSECGANHRYTAGNSACSRDPDDDHMVACALAAQTDLVVSGDRDLLELKTHRGIRIVSAVKALRLIRQPQRGIPI